MIRFAVALTLFLISNACFAEWVSSTNINPINIVDGGGTIIPSKASLYPSTNFISAPIGLVAVNVAVVLRGLTHSFPSDISMLLVGPQGQTGILMSEAGGQDRFSVHDLTLTLDDNAPTPLPIYSALTSGTYKPNNGYLALEYSALPYDFPFPAPPGNSNAPASLAVFRGTDPNGTWKLYVVDDAGGNSGILSGGWSLDINLAVPLLASNLKTNIVLSWTNAVSGCTLQCAPDLSASWTNVLPAPVVVGGRYTVTNRVGGGTALYRLLK